MGKKKCDCHEGYTKKNGVYIPCKLCITPAIFEKVLMTAIKNCENDIKKSILLKIKNNLPDYPVMACLEAEAYGQFSREFIEMIKSAYDVKTFMDVKYREIK